MVPAQAGAIDTGGGGGGGHPTENTGSLYSDLVVALRAEDGTPILKRFDIPADEDSEATTEYVVQPISYTPVPGVAAVTNPLDGRPVWVIPLQGEWLPPYDGEVPVAEIEAGDPQPQYSMFVTEAELERLNLARTSDDVIADKLAAVEEKLLLADSITLDGAGRITTDGVSLDASPEFAAMYQSLMKTGTLPGLPTTAAGPPAQVGIFDAWELAAAAIGTAASKPVPITVDTVEYYNRIVGFPESADYVSPWGVEFLRSQDPDNPETRLTEGERFVDYSGFSYNRSETFVGAVTYLDVAAMRWRVSKITDVVDFTQLTADPIAGRTLTGVTAFAQLADDVRAVIEYYHEHETIPGFYIDPVGINTIESQEDAIENPAVDLGTLPQAAFLTQPFALTASLFNPWGGTVIDEARLRVVVDADVALESGDVAAVAKEDGQSVPFTEVDGNLVGWWGPETGFPVPPGYKVSTPFDVTVSADADPGAYQVGLELVDVDDTSIVLAQDRDSVTVHSNEATILWGDEIPKLAVQGENVQVPVSVYSPVPGTVGLTLTVQGPGDDPTTELIEELRTGDVKVYGSNGVTMVAMPLTLNAEGTQVSGSWSMPVAQGFTEQVWYLVVAEGALVGNYAIDVALDGGNRLDAMTIAVAEPEQHGQQPPDAGEDTTPPTVTITSVGALGASAFFTLASNEANVSYQVRLVKDDVVVHAWEPATSAGKSYTNLAPGIYSFQAKATDQAGNVSGMYSKTWAVPVPPNPDTVAPTVTITPVGPLGASASFTLASNEANVTYQVRLLKDDVVLQSWESATSAGRSYADLAPGTYSFQAKATDQAGNVSETYSKTWTVPVPPDPDTVAPTVTITPVGPLGASASFTLASNEANVTYQVRLVKDDVVVHAWEPATSAGKAYTDLAPGTYAFQAKATDQAGNVSETYSKTWTVSVPEPTTPPNTWVIDGARNHDWVLSSEAVYVMGSSSASSAYRVKLNGTVVGTYDQPRIVIRSLLPGANRLRIAALADGKVDPTPVVRELYVPSGVGALGHSDGWQLRQGDGHLYGTYAQTTKVGETFRVSRGPVKRIALVASKGVGHGKVHVLFNGRRLTGKAISLNAAQARSSVLIPVRTFAVPRRGVVTVEVVSNGRVVRLEGIGVAVR